jgi:glycosyltransferase involved in cell wall biosynthesis
VGAPRVSIGLPVRNGEGFLGEAITSLLAQTFGDFELIIGDNASTDGTQDICREAAKSDDRVRYLRHELDGGGPWNFNFVFSQASAEYFRWAAHDDVSEPEHLRACVAALDADPDAVVSAADTVYIDEKGRSLGRTWHVAPALESRRPGGRVLAAASAIPAAFGLVRSGVLADTRLIQPFAGGDRVLLVELALRGRICRVPEALFRLRDHPASYSRTVARSADAAMWLDPSSSRSRATFGSLRVIGGCAAAIGRAPLSARDRIECRARLAELAVAWRGRIGRDLVAGATRRVG